MPVHRPDGRGPRHLHERPCRALGEPGDGGCHRAAPRPATDRDDALRTDRRGTRTRRSGRLTRTWGLKYGEPPDDHDQGRPHWLPFVLSLKLRDGTAENPAIICLESPGDRFLLQIAGQRKVILHDALEPDVTLNGAKDLLYNYLSGQITADQAAAGGMTIQGDASVLARLNSSLAGGTPADSPAP